MEARAHTTPETRNVLRRYLRNRTMTRSSHQAITLQVIKKSTNFSNLSHDRLADSLRRHNFILSGVRPETISLCPINPAQMHG